MYIFSISYDSYQFARFQFELCSLFYPFCIFVFQHFGFEINEIKFCFLSNIGSSFDWLLCLVEVFLAKLFLNYISQAFLCGSLFHQECSLW